MFSPTTLNFVQKKAGTGGRGTTRWQARQHQPPQLPLGDETPGTNSWTQKTMHKTKRKRKQYLGAISSKDRENAQPPRVRPENSKDHGHTKDHGHKDKNETTNMKPNNQG